MTSLFLLIFYHAFQFASCGKFKVVDAPFSFNSPGNSYTNSQRDTNKLLMTRIDPQKPSGPPYLIEKLNGKCFDHLENSYKYEFCPFQNVTQREQTYRWNAFQGVLGVWKQWQIENGTFTAMHMAHGEICVGTLDREVQVKLKCGDTSKIISVKEPQTCRYVMVFKTPYACPEDVFQVYPVLTEDGQKRWRAIHEDYMMGITTTKGYEKKMTKLYEDEELYVADRNERLKERQDKINILPKEKEEKPSMQKNFADDLSHTFLSKHQCVQEYQKLFTEVKILRKRLIDLENATRIQTTENRLLTGHINGTHNALGKNNIEKYKRGELGDKHVLNDSFDDGRGVNRIHLEQEVKSNSPKTLLNSLEAKPQTGSVHLRGDTGIVEEIDNPDRLLRDRLHEHGVPDHEKIQPTENIQERADS